MHPYAYVESKLSGWPDHALTWALFGIAALIVLIALFAPPPVKAVAVTYAVLP